MGKGKDVGKDQGKDEDTGQGPTTDKTMMRSSMRNVAINIPPATVVLAWSLVLLWTVLIFWGSGASAPDEPVSKPMTQPIIEPIVKPINEARGEPLPGPGYDKLDHAAEYGVLGALLWLALALTSQMDGSPKWLTELQGGWNGRPRNTEKQTRNTGRMMDRMELTGKIRIKTAQVLPPLVLLAALFASLYGATDELHQAFVDERTADGRDWVADSIGGLLGALFMALLCPIAGRALITRGYFQNPHDGNT